MASEQSGEETGQAIEQDEKRDANASAYWAANIKLLCILMSIWFAISFGAGIIFRPFLDQFMLGGYPLGFWFAQQGSIYGFIILIIIYIVRMRKIEREYDLDD